MRQHIGSDGKWRWSRGEPLDALCDNVLASKMGGALRIAAADLKKCGGDGIDHGLILLKALNDAGFDVVERQ